MVYIMYILFFVVVLGLIGVASNPSPSFAALSLVVVAGGGCGILACHGGCFLSLILFLIYLGGMLVVFAYSVAFMTSLNPEGWGNYLILGPMVTYCLCTSTLAMLLVNNWGDGFWAAGGGYKSLNVVRENIVDVSLLYSLGGKLLAIGAWALLLVLFIVLKLVRGYSGGAVRVV